MEEMRSLALAYYAHGTPEFKEMFRLFYEEIDPNQKGSVTYTQFMIYVKNKSPELYELFGRRDFFTELDLDGSGTLDFQELITFCYMAFLRGRWCGGKNCGKFLNNVYFGCAVCFLDKPEKRSYDLCLGCYRNKNYVHEHELFLDNYVMVSVAREYRKEEPEKPEPKGIPEPSNKEIYARARTSKRRAFLDTLQAFSAVSSIGSLAIAAQCTIM